MGKIKARARALSRARIKQQREITHLDVRALQSDHGHGRATDVTGADAANLNQREKEKYDLGEYKKPRCCCLQKQNSETDLENGKERLNLFRHADDDDEERERRKRRSRREERERESEEFEAYFW